MNELRKLERERDEWRTRISEALGLTCSDGRGAWLHASLDECEAACVAQGRDAAAAEQHVDQARERLHAMLCPEPTGTIPSLGDLLNSVGRALVGAVARAERAEAQLQAMAYDQAKSAGHRADALSALTGCPRSMAPELLAHMDADHAAGEASLHAVNLVDRIAFIVQVAQSEALRHVRALLQAMRTWGSWEDGIPDASEYGEHGSVGRAYEAAMHWAERQTAGADAATKALPSAGADHA